jgi:phage FluMu protein Com
VSAVLTPWRCWKCNALLGKFAPGSVGEIKCPKCNAMNQVVDRAA